MVALPLKCWTLRAWSTHYNIRIIIPYHVKVIVKTMVLFAAAQTGPRLNAWTTLSHGLFVTYNKIFIHYSQNILSNYVLMCDKKPPTWGGDSPIATVSVLCTGLTFSINCPVPTRATRPLSQFCPLCTPTRHTLLQQAKTPSTLHNYALILNRYISQFVSQKTFLTPIIPRQGIWETLHSNPSRFKK